MYTIETLKAVNQRFCANHYLRDSDVSLANMWVNFIEAGRSKDAPKSGDILRLTNKHGDYYAHAHIETIDEDGDAKVCEQPYVPFVFRRNDKSLGCNTSGGAWQSVPAKELRYVGTEKKLFCDWGNCGACSHGAIEFLYGNILSKVILMRRIQLKTTEKHM